MKKILLFIFFISLTSCEEVVDVNLSTAAPRLVVDATINWNRGTTGTVQTIKLSTTTGYYQSEIPKVSGATVNIKNSANQVFNFIEEINTSGKSGQYKCADFIPQLYETYTLTIVYGGQSYSATEKLVPSPVITDIEQRDDLGLNSDEIGLKINFNDFPNQINHYLVRFDSAIHPFPEYQNIPDEFTEGKNMAALYSNKKLKKGDVITISLVEISKTFYNYMTIVLTNANPTGPFQAAPAKIRGNIVNQTDKNNFALGYFRLGEVEKLEYSVK